MLINNQVTRGQKTLQESEVWEDHRETFGLDRTTAVMDSAAVLVFT